MAAGSGTAAGSNGSKGVGRTAAPNKLLNIDNKQRPTFPEKGRPSKKQQYLVYN